MHYVYSILMGFLCAGLGLVTLDTSRFEKIPFLKSKEGSTIDSKTIGKGLLWTLAAILFVIAFVCCEAMLRRVSEPINRIKMLIALFCLTGSACVDYREHRIPNLFPAIMAAGAIVLLALGYVTHQSGAASYIVSSALAAVGCVLFLTIASFLSKGGIGAGDIKLLGALGLLCGVYTICETAFVSVALCALTSIPLLLLKKKTMKAALPFGPFILLGFVISIVFFSF